MRSIQYHQFDVHIAHACNFSCQSCSHFSNYHFPGLLSLGEAEQWYASWSARLRPFKINLLGGEPTINPLLPEHVLLARRFWPDAKLFIYTNGSLLSRQSRLPKAIQDAGRTIIRLSRHYDGSEYEREFSEVISLLTSWEQEWQIKFEIMDSYSNWTERYIDDGGVIRPFKDGNPRQSWENCKAKYCVQMHDGMLWKCPMLAYLPMVKARGLLSDESEFYLTYEPLKPDCSTAALADFFAREEEPFCSGCPASRRRIDKMDPTKPLVQLRR